MNRCQGPLLRGVARYAGDGWKDATRKGDVVYVYGVALPPPYAAGQHPRVGAPIWTASAEQFAFSPATWWQTFKLLPTIWRDAGRCPA